MPTADASRILLFADASRSVSGRPAKVRRYRLARLQVDAAHRAGSEPRYAYLKRSYD